MSKEGHNIKHFGASIIGMVHSEAKKEPGGATRGGRRPDELRRWLIYFPDNLFSYNSYVSHT